MVLDFGRAGCEACRDICSLSVSKHYSQCIIQYTRTKVGTVTPPRLIRGGPEARRRPEAARFVYRGAPRAPCLVSMSAVDDNYDNIFIPIECPENMSDIGFGLFLGNVQASPTSRCLAGICGSMRRPAGRVGHQPTAAEPYHAHPYDGAGPTCQPLLQHD